MYFAIFISRQCECELFNLYYLIKYPSSNTLQPMHHMPNNPPKISRNLFDFAVRHDVFD